MMVKKGFTLLQMILIMMVLSAGAYSIIKMQYYQKMSTESESYHSDADELDLRIKAYVRKYQTIPQSTNEFININGLIEPILDPWDSININSKGEYTKVKYFARANRPLDYGSLCYGGTNFFKLLFLTYYRTSISTSTELGDILYVVVSPGTNGAYEMRWVPVEGRFTYAGNNNVDDLLRYVRADELKTLAGCGDANYEDNVFGAYSLPPVTREEMAKAKAKGSDGIYFEIPVNIPKGVVGRACSPRSKFDQIISYPFNGKGDVFAINCDSTDSGYMSNIVNEINGFTTIPVVIVDKIYTSTSFAYKDIVIYYDARAEYDPVNPLTGQIRKTYRINVIR